MKPLTQSQIILKLLESKYPDYVYSYDLTKVNTKWGYLGLQGNRRARELAEEGTIEVVHDKKYAKYRCKLPEPPKVLPQFAREEIK